MRDPIGLFPLDLSDCRFLFLETKKFLESRANLDTLDSRVATRIKLVWLAIAAAHAPYRMTSVGHLYTQLWKYCPPTTLAAPVSPTKRASAVRGRVHSRYTLTPQFRSLFSLADSTERTSRMKRNTTKSTTNKDRDVEARDVRYKHAINETSISFVSLTCLFSFFLTNLVPVNCSATLVADILTAAYATNFISTLSKRLDVDLKNIE